MCPVRCCSRCVWRTPVRTVKVRSGSVRAPEQVSNEILGPIVGVGIWCSTGGSATSGQEHGNSDSNLGQQHPTSLVTRF